MSISPYFYRTWFTFTDTSFRCPDEEGVSDYFYAQGSGHATIPWYKRTVSLLI